MTTALTLGLMLAAAPAGTKAPAKPQPAPATTNGGGSADAADGGATSPQNGGDTGAGAPEDDDRPTTPAPEAGEVTRYQFTGLDIDGELRTPALLQFLARIGGEFETLGIPHRSFMPELLRTSTQDAL